MESATGNREPGERLLVEIVEAVLARTGVGPGTGRWRVREGESWCRVSPPDEPARLQGWKLHVSATPTAAPLVLARAAEVLVRAECRFKFAATVGRAADLVAHRYDRAGGGKFLTAYPEGDDASLRELAAALHRATAGLPGPAILSDRPCFPGSLVHYRYGVFSGVPALGDDGVLGAMLVDPGGRLVPDRRRAWFSPPEWAPRDPFAHGEAAVPVRTAPAEVLLDGRFLVRSVIRHAFGGGVFRGVDESTGASVIIKQARPHTAATLSGHDARDLRCHEAAMLEEFAGSGCTPGLVALFEQQGDLFLVQEAVEGVTLRQWVVDHLEPDDGESWGVPVAVALRRARSLACLMRLVHAEGHVLRDFNPSNVMVADNGEVCLIDLEMLARPGEPALRIHTPGYAAAEQTAAPRHGPAPAVTCDLYSLGATFFHLVTAVDPLLAPDDPGVRGGCGRLSAWLGRLAQGNPAAHRLAPLIVALLDDDPARRPGLDEVLDRLDRAARPTGEAAPAAPAAGARGLAETGLKELIGDGVDHLLATFRPGRDDRLWPPSPVGATTDAFNVQHGAAGVLGVLVRAYEAGEHPAVYDAVRGAAQWIAGRVGREPRLLPGLHYGRSGTAWALLEAARLLGDERLLGHAMELAARVPVRGPGPDVCHGVAGAGLTQLRFWEATGERRHLDRAREAGDELAARARRRDGLLRWPLPRELLPVQGDIAHYGFAHGVAGIGAFLLALGRATGSPEPVELAVEAAETLLAAAEEEDGAAYWRSGEPGSPRKTHWCSGSSGVGTFLARVWEETGEGDFLDAAHRAAVAVRRTRWHAGTAQCHGLAGDGDFLLDLAEVCGRGEYRVWAAELAAAIHVRNVVRDGRTLVPDDTGTQVCADYGTGLSGVLAFLLRLSHGGPRLWLPRSLTETAQRG
ncbi:class IV lanthionine synthetase LanL [Streptomyces sp. NPDC059070]|uniref:class IV lanthionine synthetase LanL n=1 Tax=Streptomyces sp. NPDC059070 TaxID=3346713 RepID=UPI0036B570DF